ncbi:response regulator receiver modulated metal dependent phosphohydrolase [Candidatus Moduliflexus flocculans]|uniref:Response regulator receiver modulated metal dependent phosphohydrolase n=1 Tax=Candidatus Moduliflexus flocculans TaxID=1499966 RepID=A0A0S6VWE5_9BACT|nr:response regulator receiver modulated metal dependent phosphohydrolase [Candidatus Moduliflexus flocculans]
MNKDDELLFAEETNEASAPSQETWDILIADDEEEVHAVTRMVLERFQFEGKGVRLLSAYSGKETLQIMQTHPNIAVLILDVVMEEDTTGLDVVKHIREVLCNRFVRIILRTGQPGQAPERQVTMEYDINDYKGKSELTAQKLFTTIIGLLRAYRDLRMIERSRRGLERIVTLSAELFAQQTLKHFSVGLLVHLSAILQADELHATPPSSGVVVSGKHGEFVISAGLGTFQSLEGQNAQDALPANIQQSLFTTIEHKRSVFLEDAYLGYFSTKNGLEHIIYLQTPVSPNHLDIEFCKILEMNASIAFENIELHQEIIETQREVIFTLGEVVERRFHKAATHIKQVCAISHLLALKAHLDEQDAEMLRLAAPLHDVGMLGVPDAILYKHPHLSPAEWTIFQRHPLLGYKILKGVQQPILKLAAQLAMEHHEHWDGQGYPNGLRGEEIHLFSRILHIADVFDELMDAMHQQAQPNVMSVKTVFQEHAGTQFDPKLAEIFLTHFDEFAQHWIENHVVSSTA